MEYFFYQFEVNEKNIIIFYWILGEQALLCFIVIIPILISIGLFYSV